jgi:hypothetical protein
MKYLKTAASNYARALSTAVGIIAVALLSMANAAELLETANSGQPTRLRRYFSFNPDCTFKTISVDITANPQHGTLKPKFGDYTLPDVRTEGITQPLGGCAGKVIRVVELYYTSEKGFRGKDTFSVKATAPGYPSIVHDYIVEVK